MMTPEDYLKLIEEWKDPHPEPFIEKRLDIFYGECVEYWIVRDDMLGVGSKVRFLDYLIGHDPVYKNIQEWVFGSSPATGYAQISLPAVCSLYDKQAHLFMARRSMKKLHSYQIIGLQKGGRYHWIPNGMLPVTQKRAKDYVAANPKTRALLPIGLEHPTVTASIIKVARNIKFKSDFIKDSKKTTPTYVWTVGSSGTLNRGLQLAFPEAECHVVSVGHTMEEREIGRAMHHKSPYKFDKPVIKDESPPFPSAPTYDAKGWAPMIKWHREHKTTGPVLFWNVGS